MRELKFRAYGNDLTGTKRMIYCRDLQEAGLRAEFKDTFLMQFTGLKDKNGVEIYEGDVIRYKTKFDAEATGIGVVRWSKYVPGFAPMAEGFVEYETMEIIGNIYESPCLVDKKSGNP